MNQSLCDQCVEHIFNQYYPFFCLTIEEISLIGTDSFPIPSFSCEQVQTLFLETHDTIKKQGPLINVPLPAYIVGDIHGNFHDLLRVLLSIDDFLTKTIVFLGDYVDRGSYSLDVICLLFALVCKYPSQFYLIRGNHEFEYVNSQYGFKNEIMERYGDDNLWVSVHKFVFNFLPLAALLNNSIICLHGGLGPNVTSIESIKKIKIPVSGYTVDDIVSDIVWSDPSNEYTTFINSTRGTGYLFGRLAVYEFCKNTNINKIIRGHQCVQHGVNTLSNGQIVTVFSSSNYSNRNNSAGFIYIDEKEEVHAKILHAIHFINRSDAIFTEVIPTPPVRKVDHSNSISFMRLSSFKLSKSSFGPFNKTIGISSINNKSMYSGQGMKKQCFIPMPTSKSNGPEGCSIFPNLLD
ncbi:Serine/threonine-protein phosphatase 4 catalytic subunit [Tritrichomonas foetus]|uniref:Serine/threonine-protein phosphatase n=1 Tax=Tritrichomonas foetus TaxID=1144522 RepID=A0A1J4J7A0_9EUKA|nr:Serine/threonine-protein phosphatase 4 catalytic subunit [Tritrichomonas foetus]|eukprot:OHS95102.1 Serine/threonine-protein phosphatase 4 catalytic subunit [Tritrichomonas foetus]